MPERTCSQVEEALSAFLDGEVIDVERREIEAHLSVCPGCQRRYRAEQSVRSFVRQRRDRLVEPAPPDLRLRIVRAVQTEETQRRWDVMSRRRTFGLLALAASLVLAVIGGSFYFRSAEHPKSVVSEVVDEHIRCMMKKEGVLEFTTADPGAMSQWFQGRIDIHVAVPPFQRPGLRLAGGRLCYLLDRQGAHMVYREGAHVICLFVLDRKGIPLPQDQEAVIAGHPIRLASYKGYNVAVWEDRGLVHALVADVSPDNLKALAASALTS
jgi:anti-sigma factor (TIGR02949 family)